MSATRLIFDLASIAAVFVILVLPPLVFSLWMLLRAVREYRQRMCRRKGRTTVGFFHPYCNAGGGGERVLWCAIRALQTKYPHVDCIVYTGDVDATSEDILRRAAERLGVEPIREVEFVFLKARDWVEASRYPYFTLAGQSLGSLILGWEALRKFVPDIYIDSMGYAFTLPLFKYFGGSRVAAYVHYPTISTDMLAKVERREEDYNNTAVVARSAALSRVKLLYYRLFAYLYGLAGSCSDAVMVNSSWTKGHITDLWRNVIVHVVYPPCDVKEFTKIPLDVKKYNHIASVGQFRPEKDHKLQIKAFHQYISQLSPSEQNLYKLVLIGGCRNQADEERVHELERLANELGISDRVEFCLNITFPALRERLAQSTIGLHTMLNEHFGIGVVEIMAAGTIILAHNSGGPKMDIVCTSDPDRTGYLAHDIDSFAEAIKSIFRRTDHERMLIAKRARQSVERFSESEFDRTFLMALAPLFQWPLSKH